MADDSAELALGHQETRADPTLDVIAVAPAFDVPQRTKAIAAPQVGGPHDRYERRAA